MPWNLRGSYVETCSCELMCPCNLSFDHGATYDFCRVTLVFNIREGCVLWVDFVVTADDGTTPRIGARAEPRQRRRRPRAEFT